MSTFIRIVRKQQNMEMLVNVDHITKIEVQYAVDNGNRQGVVVPLASGMSNPAALRIYKVFVGGEVLNFASDPNDPVVREIQKIYDSAIRTAEPRETSGD